MINDEAVALLVLARGEDAPCDIINKHYIAFKNTSEVYYSTDIVFSSEKLDYIKMLILYFYKNDGSREYVIADVVDKIKFTNVDRTKKVECIPSDFNLWGILDYKEEGNTWFLINNLRHVSEEEIRKYMVKYTYIDKVIIKNLVDVLNESTRPNRIYCSKFYEEKLDEGKNKLMF